MPLLVSHQIPAVETMQMAETTSRYNTLMFEVRVALAKTSEKELKDGGISCVKRLGIVTHHRGRSLGGAIISLARFFIRDTRSLTSATIQSRLSVHIRGRGAGVGDRLRSVLSLDQ